MAVFVEYSIGGYVDLALTKQNSDFFSGLCLPHSTATEDTLKKKKTVFARSKLLRGIIRYLYPQAWRNFSITII